MEIIVETMVQRNQKAKREMEETCKLANQ